MNKKLTGIRMLSFLIAFTVLSSNLVFPLNLTATAATAKIVDNLNDRNAMMYCSDDLDFDTSEATLFNGDNSRLFKAGEGTSYAIYQAPKDIVSFSADIFEKNGQTTDSLKFYGSADNVSYTEIPAAQAESPYPNGIFDFEGDTSDWGVWLSDDSSQGITTTDETALQGTKSLLIRNNTNKAFSTWKFISLNGTDNPAPGDSIKLKGFIKRDTTAHDAGNWLVLSVALYDSQNVETANWIEPVAIPYDTGSEWIEVQTQTKEIPEGSTRIAVVVNGNLPGSTFVDELQVIKVPSAGGGWKKDESIYSGANYGFEDGFTWSSWLSDNLIKVLPSTNEYKSGAKSIMVDNSVGGRYSLYQAVLTDGSAAAPKPGDKIKLRTWVKLESPIPEGQSIMVYATYFNGNNVESGRNWFGAIQSGVSAGQWHMIESNAFELPADSKKFVFALEGTYAGKVYMDDFQIVKELLPSDGNEWSLYQYAENRILTGTRYLKVELSKTAAGEPGIEIGKMEINFSTEAPTAKDSRVKILVNTSASGIISAQDREGNPLEYSMKTFAQNGSASVNSADGSWNYTPNPNFRGEDSFEVNITNIYGIKVAAKVTIIIENKVSFNTLVFTDLDGNPINSLTPLAPVKSAAKITNNSGEEIAISFVVARYGVDHSVKDSQIVKATIAAGGEKELEATLNMPGVLDGDYIRAFIWDDSVIGTGIPEGEHLLSNVARFPFILDFESGIADNCILTEQAKIINTPGDIIAGEYSLLGDTLNATMEWNEFFHSELGLIKPDANYTLSFDYKIVNVQENSSPYVLFRSKSLNDTLNFTYLNGSEGSVKHMDLNVSIGSKEDYYFIFGARNKAVVILDNIELKENNHIKFISAQKNTPPVDRQLSLPTGAPDFSIELPNHQTVVNAADFGVHESNEDNYEAFTAAIAYCKQNPGSKLIVPKGKYHIRSAKLDFINMTDFEFDGQGSELIFGKFGVGNIISIDGSNRIALKNFQVDWNVDEDPVASRVRIVGMGESGEYLDFKFVDYTPLVRNSNIKDFIPIDPVSLSIGGVDGGINLTGANFTGDREWISEDTLRLTTTNKNNILQIAKVGNEYALRHYIYEIHGIRMTNNTNLTLDHVILYTIPGMGFLVGEGQNHWQLLNCAITRKLDSNRILSATADGLHIANTKGYFKIENCDFGYNGDDCINLHDNLSMGITVVNKNTMIADNLVNWINFYKANDVIELRNPDLSPTGYVSKAVEAVWNQAGTQCTITFEDDLPENLDANTMVFNRSYDSGNYIIRNNYFHENHARGMLVQSPNGLVENNRFYKNEQPGIQIETGYEPSWAEGYGAENVIFRNNTFESTNMNTLYKEKKPVIYMSVYLPGGRTAYPIFGNILFENNTFKNFPGVSMFLSSCKGVIVKDNTFINEGRPEAKDKIRGGIYTELSSDITVINNTWVESSYTKSNGLYYDTTNTANIVYEGNTIGAYKPEEPPVTPSVPEPAPPVSLSPDMNDAKTTAVFKIIPEVRGDIAKGVVDGAVLIKTFEGLNPDENGIKRVQLAIHGVEGAKEYVQVIPADVLKAALKGNETGQKKIEIITPLGMVEVSDGMLGQSELKNAENIEIAIREAGISGLGQDLSRKIGDKPVVEIKVSAEGKVMQWQNDNAPANIKIDCLPTAEELKNPEGIVVWYIDAEGKTVCVPNGKYNSTAGKVVFTTPYFGKYAIVYNLKSFKDAGKYDWAEKAIAFAVSRELIAGRNESTFAPEEKITRGKFVDALIKTLGLYSEFDDNFGDIKRADSYYHSLGVAKRLGITAGTGNNQFSPDAEISRQEMATLVFKAMKQAEKITASHTTASLDKYSDAEKTAEYAIEALSALSEDGILEGYAGKISPTGKLTKAEAAVILYKLHKK